MIDNFSSKLNSEENTTIRHNTSKLTDVEAIIKHCGFVSSSIDNNDTFDQLQLATVVKILNQTRTGKMLSDEFVVDLTPDEINKVPTEPSCKWICEITEGSHCDNCQLYGVIKTPNELGNYPWNKNKKYILLEKDLDKEIIVTEAILATHSSLFQQGEHFISVMGKSLTCGPGEQTCSLGNPAHISRQSQGNAESRVCSC